MPAFRLSAYFPMTTHPYQYLEKYERLFALYRPILEEKSKIIRIFETPGADARGKTQIQPDDWMPFHQICKTREKDIEAAYWFGFEFFDKEDKKKEGVGPNKFDFMVWHNYIALDACISVDAWQAGRLNIEQVLGALADLPCWNVLAGYGAALSDSCNNGGTEELAIPAQFYDVLDLCHRDSRKAVIVSDKSENCSIAGINWINIIGEPYLSRVGGFSKLRKALPQAVEMTDLGWGVILRLGPDPIAGDKKNGEDSSLYYEVGKALRSVGYPPRAAKGEMIFEDEESSTHWQRRFYDPPDTQYLAKLEEEHTLIEKVLGSIDSNIPVFLEGFSPTNAYLQAANCIKQAKSYGFYTEPQIWGFIILQAGLGVNFDEMPRYAAIMDELRDKNARPDQRIDRAIALARKITAKKKDKISVEDKNEAAWLKDLNVQDDEGRYAMPAFRLCAYFPFTSHPYHYTEQYEELFQLYRPILEESTGALLTEAPGGDERRTTKLQTDDWTPFRKICKDKKQGIKSASYFGFEFFDEKDIDQEGVGPNKFAFYVWEKHIALDACISVDAWLAGRLNIDKLLKALAKLPCWSALAGYGAALGESCDEHYYTHGKDMLAMATKNYQVLDLCHRDLREAVEVAKNPKNCGIAGINWITIVGEPYLTWVGGYSKLKKLLPEAVDVTDTEWGVIVRLGSEPIVGDKKIGEDISLYHELAKALRPVGYPEVFAAKEAVLADEQASIAWHRRFYDTTIQEDAVFLIRDYDYALDFQRASQNTTSITLNLDALDKMDNEELREYTDSVYKTIAPCLKASAIFFAGLDHRDYPQATVTKNNREIKLKFPQGQMENAWRLASLLNMLDFITGSDTGNTKELLLSSVIITTPSLDAENGMTDLFRDLGRKLNSAEEWHPDTLSIIDTDGEDNDGDWPDDFNSRIFQSTIHTKRPLDNKEKREIKAFFDAMSKMTAWTAFTADMSSRDWKEQGNILFPYELSVQKTQITVHLEYPPVSFAFLLKQLITYLKSANITLADIAVEHTKG